MAQQLVFKVRSCLQTGANGLCSTAGPNRSRAFLLSVAVVAMVCSSQARATTWIVKADGSGDAPTIQSAVSQAASGDVIQVGPGTYYEDIFITGKNLTLESQVGYANTILDGSLEDSSVVVIADDAFHRVIVSGFTIRNGTGTSLTGNVYGGGIYGVGYISLIVQNCMITNNSAGFGGGASVRYSSDLGGFFEYPRVEFSNTSFIGNSVTRLGGGLYLAQSDSEVRDCAFTNNYTPFDGGGIYVSSLRGGTRISGSQFLENEAMDKGGAVEIHVAGFADGPILEYNLFARNKASGADGQDRGTGAGILLDTEVGGLVRNNTLVFNDGTGSTGCSGGAITISFMNSPVEIRENIIANNLGCGIACYSIPDPSQIIMGENLFWQNSGGDIGHVLDACNLGWESTIITGDPFFCDPEVGDFTVREDSPALTGPIFFGAFLTAGCSAPTPTQEVTWGDIKSRFYNPAPTSNR